MVTASGAGEPPKLNIGQRNPAYSNKDVIEGNPYLPEEFVNLKNLIPDSDWWWLSSGSDLHNTKGSTSGEGSFHIDVLNFFLGKCILDNVKREQIVHL